MSEHKCVIGMYYNYEETKLVTINQLLQEIENDFRHYDLLQSVGIKRSMPHTHSKIIVMGASQHT